MDARLIVEKYIEKCAEQVTNSNFSAVAEAAQMLVRAKRSQKRIFTAGNGGSSATASHLVNDLTKGCRVDGHTGLNAMCLSDSTSVLTCLGNDFSYDEIYEIMLETYGNAGDVLIVFSGSGNSVNIVRACKEAGKMGMRTIGFLGGDGGSAKDLCNVCVVAPSDCMEMIEDFHLMYCHSMVVAIREILGSSHEKCNCR